mmetsp:Transcript_8067/g.10115  ORF Transcript_8067/g.10115 Transcript_8067/m.10115 type:complete len:81 (-) Transcript_8067:517-759(-)
MFIVIPEISLLQLAFPLTFKPLSSTKLLHSSTQGIPLQTGETNEPKSEYIRNEREYEMSPYFTKDITPTKHLVFQCHSYR